MSMFKRPYGKTGFELSAIGFGGIICMNESVDTASRYVARAIERGINYFDVAPSYGNAQDILGPALEPYRRDVFLACKTQKRTAVEARSELEGSLAALRTDYFDLYQLHAMTTTEEVDQVFAPGGAMELLEAARADGIVRYLGFSAHTEEAAVALMRRFDFTSVLFPINWVTWNTGKFGPRVVAVAQETDTAVLALKTLAKRKWNEGEDRRWPKCWYSPVENYAEAELAVRFTLSRPVAAAVSPGHVEFLWWACDAADRFRNLSEAEEQEISERAEALAPIFAV
jgi:aryl-alcohol dehydrogenase-like predicted oxidoreductase